MKIGLAQINTTVGDLAGNSEKILKAYQQLCRQGAELVVFPELTICGYPPRDLLLKGRFSADNEICLRDLAGHIGEVPALIGFAESNPDSGGRPLFNSAAWCEKGEIATIARKCLLPTYDVFDEDRYFEPARQPVIHRWKGKTIGLTICEDIWNHPAIPTRRHYAANPLASLADSKADLIINLSASPWHSGKQHLREQLLADAARACRCPLVYCNQIGGNDELVFDGHSKVILADGQILAGLAGFREDLQVVDLGSAEPQLHPSYDQDAIIDIHDALVLGLRDYALKSGFQKTLIGLSGGIDSAVVACLAVTALGPENVTGISLPSHISSEHSKEDARMLARTLGIRFETLPIGNVVDATLNTLHPLFQNMPPDVTEENVQARARGLLLMALSNKFGSLLLTTGNKSEVAVGYCTLYGDMAGGLAVLSDVYKLQVYALARHFNRQHEIIPVSTLEKPPSAELKPGQEDRDSLPPYDILDAIIQRYVEQGQSRADIIAAGFDATTVHDILRKVDLNEYKRKQAAPGLRITPLAFGVGRRIPIVQKYVG